MSFPPISTVRANSSTKEYTCTDYQVWDNFLYSALIQFSHYILWSKLLFFLPELSFRVSLVQAESGDLTIREF